MIAFSRFGHGRSGRPPEPRTPAFLHSEALEILPELLPQLDAEAPILVGHSDGASIALIHAGRHPVMGLALLAPHVVVEDVTVEAIADTRRAYLEDGLRDRMARHHQYGTLDQLDRIERRVRGPVERLVLRGGHSPHLEQPAAVATAIAAFAAPLT